MTTQDSFISGDSHYVEGVEEDFVIVIVVGGENIEISWDEGFDFGFGTQSFPTIIENADKIKINQIL